jgi:hypothetical protein
MAYFGKKEYGNYKTDICPFCGQNAFLKNKVGISVCKHHKDTKYPAMKCICGEWLDFINGKYGTYCNCPKCGNISLQKAMANAKINKSYDKTNDIKLNEEDEKILLKTQIEKEILNKDPVFEKAKKLGIKTWKNI